MRTFLFKRIGLAALSVWGVMTLVFFMTKLIPGDAARVAAGRTATPEQIDAARERLGLDQPVLKQYLDFMGNALRGNLGESAQTHQSVVHDLSTTLPVSLQLVIIGLIFTCAVAIPVGALSAVWRDSNVDTSTRVALGIFGGAPVFWVAMLLQWLIAAKLGLLPISGLSSIGMAPPTVTGATVLDSILAGNPQALRDSLAHLVLPVVALSLPFIAYLARNVRSTMIGSLESDYVSFAVSKGVPPGRLVRHHALRASMPSSLTLIGMQLGWMLGMAILVETVFGIPGIGVYMYTAVINQDTFAVLGCVLVIGIVFVLASLVVDLIQIFIDPRIRNSHLAKGARP